MAVFLSIGVLVAGVTILSLKSSAKSASDPYTVTTEAEGGMRMQPRQRLSGAAAGTTGPPAAREGEDAIKRPGATPQRGYSGVSNPAQNGASEREVMWEVGSVSSDEDEELEKGASGKGAKGAKDGKEGVAGDGRIGLGIKGARGERRGLLFEDEEDEQGPLEVSESDIEQRRTSSSRDGQQRGRDTSAGTEQDDEGFGEFESIERVKSPR